MTQLYKMITRAEAISSTGTDVFELLEVVKARCYGQPTTKLRVSVYGGSKRLVNIRSKSESTLSEISLAKKLLKEGFHPAIRFDELSFQSYAYNHSTGIVLSASDFKILTKQIEVPVSFDEISDALNCKALRN